MTPQDLINHFGTQLKAAQALGIQQPSIAGWVNQGRIPQGRQYQIQILTGGSLKADEQVRSK